MFGNNPKNWFFILKNRNKNRKILTNSLIIFRFFLYLSAQKGNLVFSGSSANFAEDSRSRGVIKSIPWGIQEWKKVRDLEDRGMRNASTLTGWTLLDIFVFTFTPKCEDKYVQKCSTHQSSGLSEFHFSESDILSKLVL